MMIDDVKHLFLCLLAIHVSSLTCWFRSCTQFLNCFGKVIELFKFFIYCYISLIFLCLSDRSIIFLPIYSLLFIFSVLLLKNKRFYTLIQLSLLMFMVGTLNVLRNVCRPQSCNDFLPVLSSGRITVLGFPFKALTHFGLIFFFFHSGLIFVNNVR